MVVLLLQYGMHGVVQLVYSVEGTRHIGAVGNLLYTVDVGADATAIA
jgi:hypothetical protein